jgi:hypothetical protein
MLGNMPLNYTKLSRSKPFQVAITNFQVLRDGCIFPGLKVCNLASPHSDLGFRVCTY